MMRPSLLVLATLGLPVIVSGQTLDLTGGSLDPLAVPRERGDVPPAVLRLQERARQAAELDQLIASLGLGATQQQKPLTIAKFLQSLHSKVAPELFRSVVRSMVGSLVTRAIQEQRFPIDTETAQKLISDAFDKAWEPYQDQLTDDLIGNLCVAIPVAIASYIVSDKVREASHGLAEKGVVIKPVDLLSRTLPAGWVPEALKSARVKLRLPLAESPRFELREDTDYVSSVEWTYEHRVSKWDKVTLSLRWSPESMGLWLGGVHTVGPRSRPHDYFTFSPTSR